VTSCWLDQLRKTIWKGLASSFLYIPRTGKNLFVDLAKRIAKELNVSKCWMCGGALVSEEWSWKGLV
jgi:hypothetical protein